MVKGYYFPGGHIKEMDCNICNKHFSGNMKNVDKQIEIHMKYKHNKNYTEFCCHRTGIDLAKPSEVINYLNRKGIAKP